MCFLNHLEEGGEADHDAGLIKAEGLKMNKGYFSFQESLDPLSIDGDLADKIDRIVSPSIGDSSKQFPDDEKKEVLGSLRIENIPPFIKMEDDDLLTQTTTSDSLNSLYDPVDDDVTPFLATSHDQIKETFVPSRSLESIGSESIDAPEVPFGATLFSGEKYDLSTHSGDQKKVIDPPEVKLLEDREEMGAGSILSELNPI